MNFMDMKYGLAQKLELSPAVEEKVEETYRMIRQKAADQEASAERKARGSGSKKITKIVLPAAAVLLLGCGFAIAGDMQEIPLFQNWIFSNRANKEVVEEIVELNPEITYEQEDPLLSIRDIYIDGTKLIFTAEATGMKWYKLEAKDHAYINGIDCMNEGFFPLESASGQYQCTIAMPENLTDNELEVVINLYTLTGIQKFGFTVETTQLNRTKKVSNQTLRTEDYSIQVSDISVAPSETSFKLCYECVNEQAEEWFEKVSWRMFYKIVDSNGKTLDLFFNNYFDPLQPIQGERDGTVRWEQEVKLYGFDYTSEYMKLIPYIMEEDEEGRVIPDTGTVYEEQAFTISLTE